MSRTHVLGAAIAATVLTLGAATVAVAAPPSSSVAFVPGPKQPIEHIGLSGGLFEIVSGSSGCYGAASIKVASFPVPRGAMVTGLTAYVVDSTPDAGIGISLNRHDLASGGTYRLGNVFTTGSPGNSTLAIDLNPGVLLDEPSSVNVEVTVGKATCFKGVEVHYIRSGAAAAAQQGTARAPEPSVTAAEPDGLVR